jgi:transcriptional regulator with XRE-family HTH domain
LLNTIPIRSGAQAQWRWPRSANVGRAQKIALEMGIVVKALNQIDISLGGRLRDKRTSTGWSEEQLAEKLQVDSKDIYAYEKGAKRITADRLLRLSKVLGVKPTYFFGVDAHERPPNRNEALLTLPDQGLRLHRAFIGVKSPALREAIVSLVTELARNEASL